MQLSFTNYRAYFCVDSFKRVFIVKVTLIPLCKQTNHILYVCGNIYSTFILHSGINFAVSHVHPFTISISVSHFSRITKFA